MGSGITGTQIGSFTSTINGSAVESLGYEYDGNGNITRIYTYADGSTICTYQYDNLNRLTRENNARLGYSYTYTYDVGGNITSKKTYAYTTGTLGSVQSTKTYTYGNSN